MTTESTQVTPGGGSSKGASVLMGATVVALVLGAVAVIVGALTGGSPAAYGALVGTLMVVLVFGFGSFTVNLVAGLAPTASLLIALMTYTLQVVLMGLIFVGLSGSGLLDDALNRQWLGGTVIAGTFGWLIAQIALTMRLRLPVYDLAENTGAHGSEAGAR